MNLILKENLKRTFWWIWSSFIFFGFGILLFVGNHDFSILVNSWHNNNSDFFFQYLTYLGDGILVFTIAFIFLFFDKKLALLSLISLTITTALVQFLKRIIFKDQLRPSKIFENLIYDGSWHTVEGLNLYEKFTFPSGHTALIFCLCITLSLYFKKNNWSFLYISLAFLVGFSRIYLSQHFLTDVLCGTIIGTFVSLLTYTYFEKFLSRIKTIKSKNENG